MANQKSTEMPIEQNLSRREMRRLDRAARREARFHVLGRPYTLIAGLGLIVLGVAFILENAGVMVYSSWWAMFLFIPAIGSFAAAWKTYQADGVLSGAVRSEIIAGLVISFIAVMVLFNLNWGLLWPIFIIIAGVSMLLAMMQR